MSPPTRSSSALPDNASDPKRARRETLRSAGRSTEQTAAAVVIPAEPVDTGRPTSSEAEDASRSAPPQSSFSSYAQAARARKRPVGALPSSPRPDIVRGEPVFEHSDFKSMERPAPVSASPNLLYVDLRASEYTAQEVLEAAFPLVGQKAIGFEFYAAQRAVALAFASETERAPFVDQPIGDTGLSFYTAPPERTILRRFTLSNVPLLDQGTILANLQHAFAPYGELVFLAPMVMQKTGWRSNMWHATLRVSKEHATTDPPPTFDMLGTYVIVDIPGIRRYCRHCQDVNHVKPSCRQGQRQRANANKGAIPRQDPPHQERQQQQPAHTTPPEQTVEDRRPPPQQQQRPQQRPSVEQTMDYEPSYQVYADQLIQGDASLPGTTDTLLLHHDLINAHDTARDHGGAFNQ